MIINERNHIASKLVVGIKDKTGETNALSYSEVQETKIANKTVKFENHLRQRPPRPKDR